MIRLEGPKNVEDINLHIFWSFEPEKAAEKVNETCIFLYSVNEQLYSDLVTLLICRGSQEPDPAVSRRGSERTHRDRRGVDAPLLPHSGETSPHF